MTTKEKIIERIKAYFEHTVSAANVLKDIVVSNALEKYQLATAKRLVNAYSLYRCSGDYRNDFLIAFRDFLLVFDTSLRMDTEDVPEENDFGILADQDTGEYYASFQFPKGVSETLAEAAFMRNLSFETEKKKESGLYTDPMIYQLTGFERFKSWAQKLAVYGALNTPDGYTTLVSLPTGGGKSLITQTAAYQRRGLTIVIVPTVSLAVDQVIAAKNTIRREEKDQEIFSYHSGLDPSTVVQAIKNETARLLFISPEALLKNKKFIDAIQNANKTRYLKNIIIDEAHIVVDWGASFRVDYQCLESWRKNLLLSNPSIRTILLSATFESSCISVLKKLFSHEDHWIEIRCDALRREPRYMLLEEKSYPKKEKRILELVRKMPHPMIIYVTRPVDAERIKKILAENGIFNVRTYTGTTKNSERERCITDWKEDRFEIMAATSAFGVGVDKSDVRTVLHLYIPENPNAYYQELGRGGRDGLPCLSIVCTGPDDINISRRRMGKRVLTTEKIYGRWDSMYNNERSKRDHNIVYIDTSIKPNYSAVDEMDDTPANDADMKWNIYVLLFLRRHDLIEIKGVTDVDGVYIFAIAVKNEMLQSQGEEIFQFLDRVHDDEVSFYAKSHAFIERAIKDKDRSCWSEMFYDTYDMVNEYCAGCMNHEKIYNGSPAEKALKVPVKTPYQKWIPDAKLKFGSGNQIIFTAREEERPILCKDLMNAGLSVLIFGQESQMEEFRFHDLKTDQRNVMILNYEKAEELLKKGNYYYISGLIGVVYPNQPKEALKLLRMTNKFLCSQPEIKVVHILKEDLYFDSLGKTFFELADGPVLNMKLFYSEKEEKDV